MERTHICGGCGSREDVGYLVDATIAALQARVQELEAVRTALNALRDGYDDLESQHNDLQAELERVRGELQSAEAGYFVAERELQGANNKYDELRTLIAALPKVEGEIEVYHHESGLRHSVVARPANKHYSSFDTPEEAEAYAALLQHRQGMEG